MTEDPQVRVEMTAHEVLSSVDALMDLAADETTTQFLAAEEGTIIEALRRLYSLKQLIEERNRKAA